MRKESIDRQNLKTGIMKRIIAALGLTTIMILGSVAAEAQGYYVTQTRPAWSQRATGAVVGAGSGAVVGAIVNRRDPMAGAAIGSVIGAGIGYLVGRSEDRNNPRPRYVQQTTYVQQQPQYNNGYGNNGYGQGRGRGHNRGGNYNNGNYVDYNNGYNNSYNNNNCGNGNRY
jgi:hypothetical protein